MSVIALGVPTDGTGLAVAASIDSAVLTAVFTGSAELDGVEAMAAIVASLHAQARERAVSEVVVDVRDLEFMNSSCFKSLVTWVYELGDLPPDARYHIRFRANPATHWQKRSLHVLKTLAEDLITIDG